MTNQIIDTEATDTRADAEPTSSTPLISPDRLRPIQSTDTVWKGWLVSFMVVTLVWLIGLTIAVSGGDDVETSDTTSATPTGTPAASGTNLLAKLEPIQKADTPHSIESIAGKSVSDVDAPGPVVVPANQALPISGWAFDGTSKDAASGVVVIFDDTQYASEHGSERPDLVKGFENDKILGSGFTATIPGSAVKPGDHTVTIAVITTDGTKYFQSKNVIRVRAKA